EESAVFCHAAHVEGEGLKGGVEQLETTARAWSDYKATADPKARDILIEEYVPLVKYVAVRVAASLPPSVEYDDLVSFGVFGLIDAIDKYELDRGVKFETYAITRIRGSIMDGLRATD